MLSEYGDILSGEQVRRILHISKRKCAWMLNNGYIKCKNSGKKSRKYTVLKSDLIEFIEESKRCPEKYVLPCGEFSSGSKNATIGVTSQIGSPTPLPDIDVDAFREWLDTEFSCLPDALTVQEVADTTGYNKHSVERWIRNGHLKCVNVQGGVKIVPKAWLVKFYCRYGHGIVRKSKEHEEMMRKFIAEM